jgi:hypothetical protein
MRKTTLCLALALLACAIPVMAGTCFIDSVPAATLLLPYFEVDLNNPNGLTTLFTVNNAAAGARLAHVTIWSDLAVPVLGFNVYLTGYDVQSVNLRDIIVNGNLPQTASRGQDPNDTISPKGPYSKDTDFASCQGQLPPPNIGTLFTAHLQAALTGQPSAILNGQCAGQALGDNVARGYITMDAVNNCTLRFPGDPGYFGSGGTGDATNQNSLWGDWTILNVTQNFAEGGALVHVEADAANTQTSTAGLYTFYGRYDGFSAIDNREPLATVFAARYLNGGVFSGGTTLMVWRDSKVAQQPFTCPAVGGARPSWYPLGEEGILFFDEQEQAGSPIVAPLSPQTRPPGLVPFPAATQRTRVGSATLPSPFNFGFLYLDLNTTVAPASTLPPFDPSVAQAYVYSTLEANGHFAVGIDSIKLDSACFPAGHGLPTPRP